jgi:hypothetical protein
VFKFSRGERQARKATGGEFATIGLPPGEEDAIDVRAVDSRYLSRLGENRIYLV